MRREFLRLAWLTITCRRHGEPPLEHPGSDEQWGTFPRIRVADLNLQNHADEDDRRWTP